MAIIKLGTTVTGIRGTLGGVTYSANKNGAYAKAWARPPIGRTARTVPPRARLSTVAATWRNIDPADQADWNDWAANDAPPRFNSLGEEILLSGYQWFVGMNSVLQIRPYPIVETAPTLPEPAAPPIDSVLLDLGTPNFRIFFPTGTFEDNYPYTFVSKVQSLGISSYARPNWLSFLGTLDADDNQGILGAMQDKFGDFQIGERFFFSIHAVTQEGLAGPGTAVEATVEA